MLEDLGDIVERFVEKSKEETGGGKATILELIKEASWRRVARLSVPGASNDWFSWRV